jgi:phosphoribosylformylglycinamidine (FGAM) synthase PurS component
MRKLFMMVVASVFITTISAAQDTTRGTRRNTRGDRNTEITTSSRTNVPRQDRQNVQSIYRPASDTSDKPDVLLDIPNLSVDEITLDVQNLKANLSLDARVASLVQLKAGVDVSIEKVNLTIKGVQATALLIVRLDNVRAIIDKTLTTLDNNPELVDRLLQTVDNTVGTVGSVANTALQPGGVISQTLNTAGQTVQRTLDATGNVVEKTLDSTGKLISSRTVGKLLDLSVVSETKNAAGQTVKRLRDSSGAVIEVVLDRSNKILSSKVVTGANSQNQQKSSTN